MKLEDVLALLASSAPKTPEQLTDDEVLALAFMSGCAMERTDTGYRVANPIGIQKFNGRFVVYESWRRACDG